MLSRAIQCKQAAYTPNFTKFGGGRQLYVRAWPRPLSFSTSGPCRTLLPTSNQYYHSTHTRPGEKQFWFLNSMYFPTHPCNVKLYSCNTPPTSQQKRESYCCAWLFIHSASLWIQYQLHGSQLIIILPSTKKSKLELGKVVSVCLCHGLKKR